MPGLVYNAAVDERVFWNVKQAREYLGVSKQKIARLIRDGELKVYKHAVDKRVKLVLRTDVENVKQPTPERQ